MQQVPATNFSRSVSQDTVSVKRGLDKRRRCFSIDPTCESRKRERGRRRIRKKERSVLDDKSSRFIPYVSSHSFSFLFLSSRSRRVFKFRFTSDPLKNALVAQSLGGRANIAYGFRPLIRGSDCDDIRRESSSFDRPVNASLVSRLEPTEPSRFNERAEKRGTVLPP